MLRTKLFALFGMSLGVMSMAVLNATAPVGAHSINIFYPELWDEPDDEIDWRFGDLSILDNAFRDRVRDAVDEWADADQDLTWNELAEDDTIEWTGGACNYLNDPGDAWVIGDPNPVPGNLTYGFTSWCVDPNGDIVKGVVVIDSTPVDPNTGQPIGWHFGAQAPPAGSVDVQGVVTHELGHLTGFGGLMGLHLNDDDAPTCAAGVIETMCDYDSWDNHDPDFSNARTIQFHDTDAYKAVYK